jgi:hypothetical protein
MAFPRGARQGYLAAELLHGSAMGVAKRGSIRFRPDSLLAVASLAGLAVPFLPFTHSGSPWDAIHERDLWVLAAPFFLPFSSLALPCVA